MRKEYIFTGILCVLLIFTIVFYAPHDEADYLDFYQAKKYLETEVYNTSEKRVTFYCGCKYDANKKVDWESCGYKPKSDPVRAARVEWEHVVPASVFGKNLPCWENGGRKNCRKKSEIFRRFEGDIDNLVPAVGEINNRRGNLYFYIVDGEPREFGKCDFEIGRTWDTNERVVEPPDHRRGEIARIWFKMIHKYGFHVPQKFLDILVEWDKMYPK